MIHVQRCPALLTVGLVVAGFLYTLSAHAEPRAPDKSAAQKLVTEATQRLVDGDYVGALQMYRDAYARYASPKILLNIGTTLRQLGRNVESATTYEAYLRDPGADEPRRADVQRILLEIDAVVGHVTVEVNDPAATVRLGGIVIEPMQLGKPIRVEPGQHTIIADRKGFRPDVLTVTLKAGERRELKLIVRPAEVKEVAVIVEKPVAGTQRTVALVLGAVGAAGLSVGAAFGIAAKVQDDDAERFCVSRTACTAEGVARTNDALTSGAVATVAFAAGAAAFATGLVLFATAPSPKPATKPIVSSMSIEVATTAAGPSLSIGGTW
jgi:hypothetical protein